LGVSTLWCFDRPLGVMQPQFGSFITIMQMHQWKSLSFSYFGHEYMIFFSPLQLVECNYVPPFLLSVNLMISFLIKCNHWANRVMKLWKVSITFQSPYNFQIVCFAWPTVPQTSMIHESVMIACCDIFRMELFLRRTLNSDLWQEMLIILSHRGSGSSGAIWPLWSLGLCPIGSSWSTYISFTAI